MRQFQIKRRVSFYNNLTIFILYLFLVDKKLLYEFYITQVIDSHKTHITSMKWFPKNLNFHKSNLIANETNEVSLLATLGEDGQMLVWDLKTVDPNKNDNIPYNLRTVHRVEINKMDCKLIIIFINFSLIQLFI